MGHNRRLRFQFGSKLVRGDTNVSTIFVQVRVVIIFGTARHGAARHGTARTASLRVSSFSAAVSPAMRSSSRRRLEALILYPCVKPVAALRHLRAQVTTSGGGSSFVTCLLCYSSSGGVLVGTKAVL